MVPQRHTLLIVDDEPDVLESLRHLFYRRYHVVTATSAAEAIEHLGQPENEVHVILTDQRMPSMTGEEFLVRARQIEPDAIRLLFTGYADILAVVNAINRVGIFRYILKPWDPIELETIIRQATEQYDLLAERRKLIADLQEANTRLVRANRELAEADQLKTAFLEVASHELNTPITIVQGLSELLLLTSAERIESDQQCLRQIAEATRQLGQMVAKMLQLVGSGDFRERLRVELTELGPLLWLALEWVSPFLRARKQRLEVDISPDLGMFEIDANKVRDVVLNLLTNAIKFTPDGGGIKLSAHRTEDDGAEVHVSDNGIGMEPRDLRRLFTPFFTEFDASHHASGNLEFGKRGLGLGLYLVKTFVEMHGGTVQAQSEPGAGTDVSFRLPRKPCRGPGPGIQWEHRGPYSGQATEGPRTGV